MMNKELMTNIVMCAFMANSGMSMAINCTIRIKEKYKTQIAYNNDLRLLTHNLILSTCKMVKIEPTILRTPFVLGFEFGGRIATFSLESIDEIEGYFDSKHQLTFDAILEDESDEEE